MSRLSQIPIRMEPLPRTDAATPRTEAAAIIAGLGGGVLAILSQVAGLLDRLAKGASASTIDLRSLPMSANDRTELQAVLGDGEVQAVVTSQGLTNIRETAIAGVWWVEHFNADRELIAESIEIARVPEFLASDVDEIATAARELRDHIVQNDSITTTGSRRDVTHQ